jgi:hypothetical protein
MAYYMKSTPEGDPYLDFSSLTRDQTAALAEVSVEDFVDGRGKGARAVHVLAVPMHRPRATPATICQPGSAGTSAGRPTGRLEEAGFEPSVPYGEARQER